MALENEERIIQQAKKDKEKFAVLYEHYVSQIYYFLLSRIRNEELAEDLTSMTFAKVLEKLHKYKTGNFRAWLYRIANNTMIDYIRKNKRVVNEENRVLDYFINQNDNDSKDLDDELDKGMKVEFLKRYIDKLPKKYQEVINLRYFSYLNNDEIAKVLKCKTNNVAVRLHRAIKKLKNLLHKEVIN